EEKYGIGLYTPKTREHFAGKFVSGEKDDTPFTSAESVNYIAGIRKFPLISLTPVNYVYYISVGSLQEISSCFRKIRKSEEKYEKR
ncbi:MAG: hypothetical protein ACI4S9_07345, partial [Christensenellales bacterium]